MSRFPEVVQRQAVTSLVFAGVAVGVVVILTSRPIRGAFVLGGSLVLAGLLRVLVSDRHSGMLVNRGRTTDALTLAALGLAVIVLAVSLHGTYADL